jgi:group I intron endonuclease
MKKKKKIKRLKKKQKMRLLKSHPLLKLLNSYLIDHSQPSNISYLWNFGSLLAICLGIQIVTGVTLAMHYNPNVLEAFNSIEHIMRDVNNGWLIRYLHSNTASAFFFLVYLHIGRGLYYGSYRAPRTLTWVIGTIILVLMMAIGFLGEIHMAQNDYYKKTPYNKFTELKKNNLIQVNFSFRNNYKISPFKTRFYSGTSGYSLSKINTFLKNKNLDPCFIYDNLQEDKVRKDILEQTKGLGGIYLILNKETFAFYIGSASTNKFNSRFTNHLIHFKGNKMLKNSVKNYKLSNFCFIILEIFPEIVTQENNKQLLDLEDFYIKSLLPDFNILTEAGSMFGYKYVEVSRLKMKNTVYSKECRKDYICYEKCASTICEFNKIKIPCIRKQQQERLNRSEETLLNLKEKSKPILVRYWSSGIIYGRYSSISEAALSLNCSSNTILKSLNTPSKRLKRRWIVNYD